MKRVVVEAPIARRRCNRLDRKFTLAKLKSCQPFEHAPCCIDLAQGFHEENRQVGIGES